MLNLFSIAEDYRCGIIFEVYHSWIGEVSGLLNGLQKNHWILHFSYTKLMRKAHHGVGIDRHMYTMRKTRAVVHSIGAEVTQRMAHTTTKGTLG